MVIVILALLQGAAPTTPRADMESAPAHVGRLPPQGKAFINLPETLIPAQQAQEAEAASAEPAAEASAPDAASDDAQNEMVGNAAEKES